MVKKQGIFALAALFGVTLYVCIFLHAGTLFPFLLGGALLVLPVCMLTIGRTGKWAGRVNRLIVFFTLTYVFIEVLTYGLLSFGLIRTDMGFFFGSFVSSNRPILRYDTVCGYRSVPGVRRHVSINEGELEFDHLTVANTQGWYSKREYIPAKGGKKRYMVLGDSYSAGLSTPLTWVDIIQDKLVEVGNDSIELYNFSQEGAGLVNWYRIYRYEIVPYYDFDGIIFAASSEKGALPDLDRNFIMGHSYNDVTCMAVIDLRQEPLWINFDKRSAIPIFAIYPDAEIDEVKERYLKGKRLPRYRYRPPDLYFLRMISQWADALYVVWDWEKNMSVYQERNRYYETLAEVPYQEFFFRERYRNAHLLYSIWQGCRMAEKEFIWVTIPDYEHAIDYVKGKNIVYRNEASYMTKRYNVKWFDGFEILTGKDEKFVQESYYKYDMHWNEKTVRIFSGKAMEALFGP